MEPPTITDPQLLFKGSWQATENDQVALPTIYVHETGSGNATGLGRFTACFEAIVQNDVNGVGTAVVATNFTAASGDILFAEGTGTFDSTEG